MRRLLGVVASAVFVLVCSGAEAPAAGSDGVTPYLRPERLVDVGGHKINLYCTGHGSPAVILDAGQGETTYTWRKVQPAIAKFTRVCSFDRAAMGFSEAGPLPRDANAMVGDMHALFRHARIAPPYVLVGHSIAGLYALLYADRYPRQVAGMVLVDPSFPNQNDTLYAASPSLKRMSAGSATAYTFCYQAALHGRLSLDHGAEEYALCGYPPDVAANVRAQCAKGGPQCEMLHQTLSRALRPSFWAALGSEDKASDAADAAEDLKEQRSYGAMPLIVLTAADELRGSPFPPAENRALQRAWTAGHERLARLSTAGTHSVIQDSGHFIQLDQPAAVTAAVAGVVRAAKH